MALNEETKGKLVDMIAAKLPPAVVTGKRETQMEAAAKSEDTAEKQGVSLCRYLRGCLSGNWHNAKKEFKLYEEAQKDVMTGADTEDGGFLAVPPILAKDVIELARAQSPMREVGAMTVPAGKSNSLQMPKQTTGATVTWIDEDGEDDITDTSVAGSVKTIYTKQAAAMVKIANTLIADSSPAADAFVRNDLSKAIRLGESTAFLLGTGGKQPIGLYNWPGIPFATLTGAITADNLIDMQTAVEEAEQVPNFWMFNSRLKGTLRKLKDENGQYIWQKDLTGKNPDMLLGLPCKYTNIIPNTYTYGSITSGTWIALGNWSDFVILDKAQLLIDVSNQAGTAFQKNQTWIRAIIRVGCGIRREESFYILKGAKGTINA